MWYPVTTGIRSTKPTLLRFTPKLRPRTASIVWNLDYEWHDQQWMSARGRSNSLHAPISIYEMHLGSWQTRA